MHLSSSWTHWGLREPYCQSRPLASPLVLLRRSKPLLLGYVSVYWYCIAQPCHIDSQFCSGIALKCFRLDMELPKLYGRYYLCSLQIWTARPVQVNEYGANTTKAHPSKFGFFAALPIPDINASLAELEYALDVLNASGVVLMANLHGKYLGDSLYEPLWEELDRRGTVRIVHIWLALQVALQPHKSLRGR